MNVNQIKIKIRELESNLENKTVQSILEENKFELEKLKRSLKDCDKYIEQINNEELIKTIETKINELISHSNQSRFRSYSHQFINAANFLISNTPKETDLEENTIVEVAQISEEEFSKRYDKLIESLNFEGQESNLILETPSDKVPFQVYKNTNKSIVVKTKGGTTNTRTKEKLIGIAFRNESDEKRSYDKVLIEKLLDNSIFDYLANNSSPDHNSKDLIEAMKKKLLSNENELLKLSAKLEEIEKSNQELLATKEQLTQINQESNTAKQDFISAKQAAVDYAKLNASVSYWQEKQTNHKTKFWWFGGGAIWFIGILILILFMTLNNHENQINGSKKTEIVSDKNTTNEIIQDVNKSISAIKQTLQESKNTISSNEENNKSFDFDYSKLAWYILMIFASSSAFWIIRITVKIALSNLHLSEDAHERVVMIQTYLSFVNEGQIDENDKNLILSSLFRPSNIGIIKDESSVTVADIITAFKK